MNRLFHSSNGVNAVLLALLTSCSTQTAAVDSPQIARAKRSESKVASIVHEVGHRLQEASESPPLNSFVIGVQTRSTRHVAGFSRGGTTPDGDTIYRVASLTKPFTALLTATYVAEGRWQYLDMVGRCQKKTESQACQARVQMTWLDLLTHYAGLPMRLPDNTDLERFLNTRTGATQDNKPTFAYSTTGYAALGWFIEKATSQPFSDNLRHRVLGPLQLKSTVFTVPTTLRERVAPGYRDGRKLPAIQRPRPLWPSGGLYASANDLLRFIDGNLSPTQTPALKQALLLTQKLVPERPTFPGSVAAYGWHYFTALKTYWHAGNGAGHTSFLAFNPAQQTGVVILVNTGLSPQDSRLAQTAFGLLPRIANITAR